MNGTYSKQKGFTLIEFIMAMIILGIIGAITFQVVSYGVEVYMVSEKRKELYDFGRLALERMVRETRTAGKITTPTVGNSGNTLIFNKSAYSYASGAPLDTSTTITFQLNGSNLERVGDISGTNVLASYFSSFYVTHETGNLLTLNITLYSANGGTVSMRTKAYARNAP